jgi:ATP-dependent NAD(P)H-hydrate dehydratase
MTPNLPELGDLAAGVGIVLDGPIGPEWQQQVPHIAAAFQGPTILSKGPKDLISNGDISVVCDSAASPRRAGGQGDVMAGTVAAYASWAENHANAHPEMVMEIPYMILAAYGGSWVTRKASVHAFDHHKHGMLAGNLISFLPRAVYETEQP